MADIEIKRGYEVLPDNNVRFGIRVINNSDSAIMDVEVIIDYSKSLFDLEGSKIQELGTIPPDVPQTAKFVLKPRGCIHKAEIGATVNYRDHRWKKHKPEMRPKEIHCVCPFLQEKSITRADFLTLLDSGYLEERGVNFEGVTVDKVVDFLHHTCKNRLYRVDKIPIENGTILYLAGDALGEKAYYLLTAVVKEYKGVTQVLLRANSDKSHGLNGFLNEILDNLRHLVLSAEAREIGIIKKEQVINIIDSVVQRTTFAGGEGVASVNIRDSVVQRTEIKEDAEKRKREAEERRARGEAEREERAKAREEEERLQREEEEKAKAEREKRSREEAERKEREEEKAREEERRKKQREGERKAKEAAEQREAEKIARKEEGEAHATKDSGSSQKKILAVVLVLGALLVGYWAFASGSTEAPELIETPTPDEEQTPKIAQVVSQTPALTSEQIEQQIMAHQDSVQSFTCRMVMTSNDETMAMDYAYKQPNMIQMEYTEPSEVAGQVMVSNGTYIWMYDPAENIVKTANIPESAQTNRSRDALFLKDLVDTCTIVPNGVETISGRQCYRITATPDDASMPMSVEVWLDKWNWMPLKIETYQNGELLMSMEYRDIEFNVDIPNSTFEFEIPEGATVESTDETAAPATMTIE